MGIPASVPVSHLLYKRFEHSLHLCTMETALWDCDFCPASCQDVPKEAEKYRPEFLGTHFTFGLNQSSELCLHRLQEEKSSTDFSVRAAEWDRLGCVSVGAESLRCVREFPLVHRRG